MRRPIRTMKKGHFTKLLALLLAMVMVFALPLEASAAKKVTANTNWKKAKAVKAGSTTVTAKSTSKNFFSYVKFTATKTKTYKITIGNLRKPGSSSSKDIISAAACLQENESGYLERIEVKQNGEKTETLWIESAYAYSLGSDTKTSASSYLKSRTASVKLKKGETIYISFGFSASGATKCLYDLKIK